MQNVLAGIQKFQSEVYPDMSEHFKKLGSGQSPAVLLVTCSDSRIDPSLITQTYPGDLFIIRNAGNLIPEAGKASGAEAGTIEYGVKALGVQHIVVCGHSHCGAMAAVLEPSSTDSLPHVKNWLEAAGCTQAPGSSPSLDEQIQHNIVTQLDRLRSYDFIREAEAAGKLSLHGWIYHFESGEFTELEENSKSFNALSKGQAV